MKKLSPTETLDRIEEIGIRRHCHEAFAFRDQAQNVAYDWHSHDSHQLLYAISGILHVETAQMRYILPPQKALWIPAHTLHRTWLDRVQSATVFFPMGMMDQTFANIKILSVPSVMREMIMFATRWPPGHGGDDDLAQSYFQTLALLCREWVLDELPFHLPRCDHPSLVRAMDYVQEHLATANLKDACAVAAMSERSFRRHFVQAMGMGWQDYVHHSRMMRALALLSTPTLRIGDVAEEVGFTNLGVFSRTFRDFSGENPSEFRSRLFGKTRL